MDEVISYVDVRSAEVAMTAIASDVAQVHQDMLDADADAQAAAASAAAAAGTLANAVKKTGEASQSIAGDIAVAGDLSVGGTATVQTPVNNTDAATKKYVDDQDAALKTYVDAQDATKISITSINSYALGLTGNQTASGEKKFTSPIIGQMRTYKSFGSNTNAGWYAICKFTKSNARQAKITVSTPGNYNIVLTDTSSSTHNLNVIKYVGSYTPNKNSFLLAEVSDGYILYVYSATYRTNILVFDYYGAYGTQLDFSTLDDSVFTGQPETTKPAVGGSITAIYDENYLTEITS